MQLRPTTERASHGARIVQHPLPSTTLTLSSISECRPPQLARDGSKLMTDTTLMETEGQHDARI